MRLLILLYFICFSSKGMSEGADSLDDSLQEKIKLFNLSPLEKSKTVDSAIFLLGEKLFKDKTLSGNKNISCQTCHDPNFGTGDGLPFSIGEGGVGVGRERIQASGVAVRRNAPHLYNLGYPDELRFMFWDGRVSYSPTYKSYRTPEKALNGANPVAKDITDKFNGALSAQTIFPIVNHDEMRGQKGTNEIANAKDNLEAWSRVVKRLMSDKKYVEQFKKAYGDERVNIGHVARALGDYIGSNFNYNDTPFDRYMNGDLQSLTKSQKRGALLFLGRGKCLTCHKTKHLGGTFINSAGTPEISLPSHPLDKGLYETTKRGRDSYKFLSKTLRNTALTAPYMHNGALKSLRDVIEHYNNVKQSLENYVVPSQWNDHYNNTISVDTDEVRNSRRMSIMMEATLKFGLHLSERDKEDLYQFLKYGLTDYRLHSMLSED